jgi:hypothetical protein
MLNTKDPEAAKKLLNIGSKMFDRFVTEHGITNIKWGVTTDDIFEMEGEKVVFVIECSDSSKLLKVINKFAKDISSLDKEV